MGWCYRRLGIRVLVVLRGRTLGRSGLFTFVGGLVDIYMIIIGVMVMGYELWVGIIFYQLLLGDVIDVLDGNC